MGPVAKKKRQSSRYAVLGMLSMGLETGYSMKKHVETNLGHFWSESYGRIYPILRQLVDEGLATCEAENRAGGRRRNRYRLTDKGWQELREWLAEPPERQPRRHELLLKLSFGERVPRSVTEKMIREHRDVCERDVDGFTKIEEMMRTGPELHRDQPFWLMTLRFGRVIREAEKVWCEEALEHLATLDRDEDDPPS